MFKAPYGVLFLCPKIRTEWRNWIARLPTKQKIWDSPDSNRDPPYNMFFLERKQGLLGLLANLPDCLSGETGSIPV